MAAVSNISYTLRGWRKNPGFALAVILSLALGIGANAAIFSVVNGLLLHPAGALDPENLVAPRVTYKKLNLEKVALSAPDFADVRDQQQVFSKAAMFLQSAFNYTGGESPERLQGGLVTWQWFDVFGRTPMLGRAFNQEEDQKGANHVTVLSYKLWQRLFGGDRGIVGRTIELNKVPYRVIGVMPPDLWWPVPAELWMPIGLDPKAYGSDNRFNENYFAIARLAPGVTYNRAVQTVQALSNQVLEKIPFAVQAQWSIVLEPITEYAAGNLKTPMLILLGAVAVVLLIACSNIAGLMLVRTTGRSRELAIRTALGAGRSDLVAQSLTEALLLAIAGTALGFVLAYQILNGLLVLARVQLATELVIGIDGNVLLFTACAGVLSALVFGAMPAWHSARLGKGYDRLKAGGRGDTENRDRRTFRSALVASQIALALVLLIGAGLLLKTLVHLRNTGAGFDPRGVMSAAVALPPTEYNQADRQAAFFRSVLDRISQTPGIVSAGAGTNIPFSGGDGTASFSIEGRIVPPGDPGFHGSIRSVTPEYFRALQIPLLQGRYFNDADRNNSQAVAIIDTAMAKRYWPNQNAIGQRLRQNAKDSWATIVGIVGHVKQSSVAADEGRGTYYFSLYQQPATQALIVARGRLSSMQIGSAIRDSVHAIDPAQAVFDAKSMDERIALSLGPQQFATRILTIFAVAALLLAVIGLYGVISYNVARRTREIGIRTALGAENSRILSLVFGESLKLLGAGLLTGLVVAAALGRLIASELFDVSPLDPATLATTTLVLTAAVAAATFIPAWRATRVDPVNALRTE